VILGYAQACATALPSETPLGKGPLARASASVSAAGAAPAVDAGPPEPSPAPEATAELLPPTKDAGSSDAGPATASAAPSMDAGAVLAAASTGAAFVGSYLGKDRALVRLSGKPDQTEDDPKARINIAERGTDAIGITLVNSADGSPICTLNARVEKSRAEVAPGQPCFASGPSAQSNVMQGSASIAGKRLTLDLRIEMRVTANGQLATGSIDYHFEGTRQ